MKSVIIQCRGRGFQGEEVLDKPIAVIVELDNSDVMISVGPNDCPFNTGGHGQRCKASHPHQDKVGAGVGCPFSFDYPYCAERPGWTVPNELKAVMQELETA